MPSFSEALRLCVCSFLVGGGVCALAQLLIDKTSLTPARILVLYVCAGVALGALGVFEPLAAFCGCGIRVPLIGFGASIARGVRTAVQQKGLPGVLSGGFCAASPGCGAALIFGYLAALFCRARPKRASRRTPR